MMSYKEIIWENYEYTRENDRSDAAERSSGVEDRWWTQEGELDVM